MLYENFRTGHNGTAIYVPYKKFIERIRMVIPGYLRLIAKIFLPKKARDFLRERFDTFDKDRKAKKIAIAERLHAEEEEKARIAYRLQFSSRYFDSKLKLLEEWIPKFTETSNFYYRLTPVNRDQLAQFISVVTEMQYECIVGYLDEIEGDAQLRRHLESALTSSTYGRDIRVEYGRRIGWYALVRVLKPRVVVETGVDHGVGSCVIASALLRNAAEGHSGRYYGTEIRTEAGQLFTGRYKEVGEILYGDSIASLKAFKGSIDIFINDSDHSANYEYEEYLVVKDKLSLGGLIIGDNAHVTDRLSRFSRETGRKFLYFAESPADHWYPGAGIGVSFVP